MATAAVALPGSKQMKQHHHSSKSVHTSSSTMASPPKNAQKRIDTTTLSKSAAASSSHRANGDHHNHPSEDEDDNDRGEGTSADRATIMARIAAAGASGHLDIASLLKEPLVFVQAKHADEASKKLPYEPLTADSVKSTPQVNGKGKGPASGIPDVAPSSPDSADTSSKGYSSLPVGSATTASTAPSSIHSVPLPTSWPQAYPHGPGYHNLGNTCFLNSVLQSLTHTAPLVACLMGESYHSIRTCKLTNNSKFCFLCAMQKHVRLCFSKQRSSAMAPDNIVKRLSTFAKGMRVGRQEDAHEFLRFFLDAMQTSAAVNMSPPAKTEQQKESTFLARIFGGKLRSRVTCSNCKANSDTFDSFMDLSLDVASASSVREAFQAFIKVDILQGQNKYKCEKCKKLVAARKQFTINKAPQILHIHLKRFTPTGRKIVGHISYPEQLSLGPYMSEETDDNPTYRLYAVVCHSGHGPHSGHYFANVRAGDGKWFVMNDSSTNEVPASGACNQRNAYLLFYERTNRLGDAVGKFKVPGSFPNSIGQSVNSGSTSSTSGKRKDRDEDEKEFFPQQRIKTGGQPNGVPKPAMNESSSSPSKGNNKSSPQSWNGFSQPGQMRTTPPSSPSQKQSLGPRPASVLQQHQRKMSGSGITPLSTKGFFGQASHKKQGYRPKMIGKMVGRPR